MMKFLDTVGGFIDLFVLGIIFPLYFLAYVFVGFLMAMKYTKSIKFKLVRMMAKRKRPSFTFPVRLQWKFYSR
jgi:hypothetical protein